MKKIIFMVFVLASIKLYATNYYVSSSAGNNSFNGLTPSTAKQTLGWFSWSTTFLQPGDTVFVMAGTYTNGTSSSAVLALRASGSSASPIVITNFPNHAPLLSFNSWSGISLSESVHDIVINGLRIRGNNANITLADALNQPNSCANPGGSPNPIYNGNGITIDGRNGKHIHHVTISNCEIFECGGGGIASMESDYLTYQNNTIYNTSWYALYGTSGISNLNSWNYDSHSTVAYSNIVRNNICYGNEMFVPWIAVCDITDGNGIIIDSEVGNNPLGNYTGKTLIENNVVYKNGGRGIALYKSDNVDIINNTCFFNCRSDSISDGEITINTAVNARVFNNIMYARTGERANYKNAASTNFSSGNNLVYNYSAVSFTSANDLIAINPQFTDTALSNFTLSASSPAINAGSNVAGQFSSKDINGVSRPQGIGADMGAYEQIAAAICAIPSALASMPSANSSVLSWSNTGAVSYNLQYKLSSSSTWITVSSVSNPYTLSGLTACSAYQFQVKSVCNTSSSIYSSPFTFTTTGCTLNYCSSYATNTSKEYINRVQLGTLNNVSGNNNGYGNFTSMSTNLSAGTSATITLTPGFTSGSRKEAWDVYIDYNQNGSFNDAGEKVATGVSTTALSKNFTIPLTALSGTTRMRVQMGYKFNASGSCAVFTFGEVEDYSVIISGGASFRISSSEEELNPKIADEYTVIYPNPTNSKMNVRVNESNVGSSYIITDQLGKIVMLGKLKAENSVIELANLSPGIYLFSVGNKMRQTLKVIKN